MMSGMSLDPGKIPDEEGSPRKIRMRMENIQIK